ncbi:MAG: hypothetical protein JO362_14090 [Streptomycetaceae bacterium]|nr:hypothetical protein [Streptomycetaceae bacterium]
MTRSFPVLGFDPAPGDPDEVDRQARELEDASHLLSEVLRQLDNTDRQAWQGETADALRQHLEHDVTPLVRKTRDAFSMAADTYRSWAARLRTYQAEADALERQGGDAVGEQLLADQALRSAGYQPEHRIPASNAQAAAAQNRLNAGEAAATAVSAKAQRLHEDYLRDAGHYADQLQHADQQAPHKPHGGFMSALEGAWQGAKHWAAEDLPKDLANLGDIFGDGAAISSLVGLGAGVTGNEYVAGLAESASTILTLAAFESHGVARLLGDKEVTDATLIGDMVGVVTMGIGKDVQTGLKVMKAVKENGKLADDATRLARVIVKIDPSINILEQVEKGLGIHDKNVSIVTIFNDWHSRKGQEAPMKHLFHKSSWVGGDEPQSTSQAATGYFSAVKGTAA